MEKKLLIIFVWVFLAAGCGGNISDKTGVNSARIDTGAGMAEHLRGQHLPAVESVEQWVNDYGDGVVINTPHYQVYTTLLEPLMLSSVGGFLESAYQGYQGQLPAGVSARNKFTVYLFSERAQWDDFTKAFAGEQWSVLSKIRYGAYYLNGSTVAYNIGRERTFSALGHECWHQFNSRLFKFRLPSWLDEGIAMHFEVSRYEGGLFYFEPGRNLYRLGSLKKTLSQDIAMSLQDLLMTNPGEMLSREPTGAVLSFYGQAYALVRFLREESYGRRLAAYQRLLLDGLEGRWPISEENKRIAEDRNVPLTVFWNRQVGVELFMRYIGGDSDEIEGEYIRFCRKIVYNVRLE